MWTNSTLRPIQDNESYIAPSVQVTDDNGKVTLTDMIQYPGNYPKSEIPGLFSVTLTDEPTDPTLVVTGFTINSSYVQVWATRSLTTDEQTAYRLSILSALASHRYEVENSSTILSGSPFSEPITFLTDSPSQIAIMGAMIIASANPSYTVNWKTPEGFKVLNAAQIIAAAMGIAAFIQKCFNTEQTLINNADSYSTAVAIITAFDEGMSS